MAAYKHIYVGQPFGITLDTKTNLSTATTLQVRYIKPDKTIGYKDAEQLGQTISAQFTSQDNSKAGEWEFRAWVEFGSGTGFVPGVPYKHNIEKVS